jgi:biopolymer transport protein ExbD/biopolymer transport protein TolR
MAIGRALRDVNSDINVTPMVDVMLVLLIIFMVITPMLQKGVSVDMVKAVNPHNMSDADKEDAVMVAVTRDGRIYLGSDQVTLEDLTNKVRDRISARVDKTVYIKADSRAKYDIVVKAVNEVRSAGVDQLGLLADKVEGTARRMSL